MQQILVPLHRRGSTFQHDLHAGGAIGMLTHQTDRGLRHRVQVDGPAFRDAHAREVQKLRQEPRQAVAFPHDEVREELLVGVGAGRTAELLHRAADGRERVFDLVRQARRQLRNGLQPLSAEVQLLQPL